MRLPPRQRLWVLVLGALSAIVICLNSLTITIYRPERRLHANAVRETIQQPVKASQAVNQQETVPAYPICRFADEVFFLKTHKTGSSTVLNVLLRFADEYNRTVAVPRIRSNLMNYPRPFREHFMFNYTLIKRRPEIFAVHTRLDIVEAKRIMSPRTKFITIVRHPLKVWESGYNYFNLRKKTKLSLEEFVFDEGAIRRMQERRFSKWFGFNMMFFDMGFEENFDESAEVQANRAIALLEKNFDLVMVAEFMEESLVLLKEELCWDPESIVTFRHNERNSSIHSKTVSEDVAVKILDLNDIDARIYDHFLEKFLQLLDGHGHERMFDEVRALKLRNKYWSDRCVAGHKHGFSNTVEFVPVQGAPAICSRLTLKETMYIAKFRAQYITELRQTRGIPVPADHRRPADWRPRRRSRKPNFIARQKPRELHTKQF